MHDINPKNIKPELKKCQKQFENLLKEFKIK